MDLSEKTEKTEFETEDSGEKRRGRPKKSTPPVVSENSEQLNMEQQKLPYITLNELQDSLTKLYSNTLGINATAGSWMGKYDDLNRYNPFMQNMRLKALNSKPATMDRATLIEALASPQNHEMALRQQSWGLANAQYLYYKILRLAADVPEFKYYKVPELLKESDYKKPSFTDEDAFVDNWLQTFNVPSTLKKCALDVKREGKTTYVLRNSLGKDKHGKKITNFATWQKLPSDYVKLTGIGEHGFIASFNFMIFMNMAYSPLQYPEFMRDIWEELIVTGAVVENTKKGSTDKYAIGDLSKLRSFSYDMDGEIIKGNIEITLTDKQKSYAFWVALPQDLCYTFCSDTSNAWALPDTAGLFLGLQELADYDVLAGLVQSTPLTALLTAEAEVIPNPNAGRDQTVLNPETIVGFQEKFNTSSSTNLEAFFAPFKNFKLLTLPNVPNSSQITTDATKNFVDRAGMGGLIVTTDKPSVTQVKGSQMIAESEARFVTYQFESVINMIVNKFLGCEYRWKISIWGSIFSMNDEIKNLKEQVSAGMTFMLPRLASAYGLTVRDTKALASYISATGIYDDLKTLTQDTQLENALKTQTVAAQATESGTKSVGRPAISDSDVESDNTAASKDSGLDTSDTRA